MSAQTPASLPAPGPVPALLLRHVTKAYPAGAHALDDVSLQIPGGTFTAVMGASGSGKSSLLHSAAGLDVPTSGEVWIGGTEISRLSEAARTVFRRDHVGFVFQSYNLLPSLTVEENVMLPLRLAAATPDRAWLAELVERMGLGALLQRRPDQLSGGQQQRAAIVRALAAHPDVVFADEPTGALDIDTASVVLDLLRSLVDELGQTVVMVTHDPAAAARADATVVLEAGRISAQVMRPTVAELTGHLTRRQPRTQHSDALVGATR